MTEVTVKVSVKVPKGVVNDFVKVAPSVIGVGEVILIVVPVVSPMLLWDNDGDKIRRARCDGGRGRDVARIGH